MIEANNQASYDPSEIILKAVDLKTYYPLRTGFFGGTSGYSKAVDGVTFEISKGETLALVGESGCGKTTIAKTILNLVKSTDGEIYYKDKRIDKDFKVDLRKDIQMVFQDPDASLNPRMRIVDILGEPLRNILGVKKRSIIRKRALELLNIVSMKREHLDRYPHEFSGGQKQRIVIARALACNPKLIILDEPTSALDVSVQAQILNLLVDLQEKFGYSYLFITHDLSVVHHIAHRVAVMYLGHFVEMGTIQDVFEHPKHPYTKSLLSARPMIDVEKRGKRIILEGEIPSPINPPSGCPFHPRCPDFKARKDAACAHKTPVKKLIDGEHYYWTCHSN